MQSRRLAQLDASQVAVRIFAHINVRVSQLEESAALNERAAGESEDGLVRWVPSDVVVLADLHSDSRMQSQWNRVGDGFHGSAIARRWRVRGLRRCEHVGRLRTLAGRADAALSRRCLHRPVCKVIQGIGIAHVVVRPNLILRDGAGMRWLEVVDSSHARMLTGRGWRHRWLLCHGNNGHGNGLRMEAAGALTARWELQTVLPVGS